MAYDALLALQLTKARLNRLQSDTSLDAYLDYRIAGADNELDSIGIYLNPHAVDDMVLLADYVAEGHMNRDRASMPEWLRLKRRERWLRERVKL